MIYFLYHEVPQKKAYEFQPLASSGTHYLNIDKLMSELTPTCPFVYFWKICPQLWCLSVNLWKICLHFWYLSCLSTFETSASLLQYFLKWFQFIENRFLDPVQSLCEKKALCEIGLVWLNSYFESILALDLKNRFFVQILFEFFIF